jgi:ADP-dependent NAD(P)H-hydrate dehydratase / NAD(P)H-hydrate epimerase
MQALDIEQFGEYLQPRPTEANKGMFGHVLVVGGDYGYSGSVHMAGEAAMRVGAGLVSVATRPEHACVMNVPSPELMCHGIKSAADLAPLLAKANVVIAGPGLGRLAWGEELLAKVLSAEKNFVVDADALNMLAEQEPMKKATWILTPHPGEAARLLKTTVQEIQQDRVAAVQELQRQYGGVCVLKGAGSLVLGPDGDPSICTAGNPGMATGGMGDILSGVIGGLLAQGVPLADAAKLGVLVHAMAGDLAAQDGGERGMIASDLMMYLRHLVN